jgi:hypothetical protein
LRRRKPSGVVIRDRPRETLPAAGFVFSSLSDVLQHDFAPMRVAAMLGQVDRLPGA